MDDLKMLVRRSIESTDNPHLAIEELRLLLNELSTLNHAPIDGVRWIPIEKVHPNAYNPNQVAHHEMQLLVTSILHDGYTQPVVTIYNEAEDTYEIVDGFHRYRCMKEVTEINQRYHGLLPITVINKPLEQRMASTIRHNRARGQHQISGMAKIVLHLLHEGYSEAQVCNELGMEPDEVIRLQHITGFAKLFADHEYRKSWMSINQIKVKARYEASLADDLAKNS